MDDHSLKYRKAIIIWLLTGCFLIAAMVIIGGITRLTGSGLSITEWKLIHGTIPPLNEQQWNEEFNNYKQIPQYQLLNYHYTLDDFKKIFFWEYFHRLMGRFIGLVFIVPFIFFWRKKQFNAVLMKKVMLLFLLGALQGFLGWFMVKSGLKEGTSVSHFRLAIHLMAAFITFGFTFNVALDIIYPQKQQSDESFKKLYRLSWITMLVLNLQIIYGAFVAGLKAGRIFNTWPKMEDEWVSSAVTYAIRSQGAEALFSNMAVVQFIHRCVAYAVVVMFFALFIKARRYHIANGSTLLSTEKINALALLPVAVLCQFVIGICTLLFGVPLWLGVLHQVVAFCLFALMVFIIHRFRTMPS